MSEHEDDRELVETLKSIAPRPPSDAKFWDDFGRSVRVQVADVEDRRRRGWRRFFALSLVTAAIAVGMLILFLRGGQRLPIPYVALPEKPNAPVVLPVPTDLDELDDDQLDDVFSALDEDDDTTAADLDTTIDTLDETDLARVYDALEGA